MRLPATGGEWGGGQGGRREGVLLLYLLNTSQEVVARRKGLTGCTEDEEAADFKPRLGSK